ncbi:MAG: hypothetical protein K5662_00065 [Lachnospiraceae bacterium]|nr:hypothetical protein [Lachnospiraceae bacterium]
MNRVTSAIDIKNIKSSAREAILRNYGFFCGLNFLIISITFLVCYIVALVSDLNSNGGMIIFGVIMVVMTVVYNLARVRELLSYSLRMDKLKPGAVLTGKFSVEGRMESQLRLVLGSSLDYNKLSVGVFILLLIRFLAVALLYLIFALIGGSAFTGVGSAETAVLTDEAFRLSGIFSDPKVIWINILWMICMLILGALIKGFYMSCCYLFVTEEELGVIASVKKGLTVIMPKIGQYLLLCISFVPLHIVGLLSFGIGEFFLHPYTLMADLFFMRDFCGNSIDIAVSDE